MKVRPGQPANGSPANSSAPGVESADPAEWSTVEAVRRKVIATAQLRQIEADVAAGKLAKLDAITREWSAILASVRSRMLAVPARVGSRLSHLTRGDVAEIDREVRDALTELGGADVAG